uniref:Col_cuticle_N domain-containing protein n=1 Tax=Rhabditophanes sp. KR3021 TaxID=114890 RepID=A0AC35TV71_9BILA
MSEQQYVYRTHRTSPGLTEAEIIVLISSVLFFIAFLMSLFTQYKAENTMFKSLVQIILTNKNWAIRNYDEGERNVYHASISTSIHNQDRKMLLPEGIQTDIDKEYLIV